MRNAHAISTLMPYAVPKLVSIAVVLLTLSFVVLMFSALTGFQAANVLLRANPFQEYESLWLGQPSTSIADYLRRTPEGVIHCIPEDAPWELYVRLDATSFEGFVTAVPDQSVFCQQYDESAVFRLVTVMLREGRVVALRLFSTDLHQDALYLYWGLPDDIVRNQTTVTLQWDRSAYSAVAVVNAHNRAVHSVVITDDT